VNALSDQWLVFLSLLWLVTIHLLLLDDNVHPAQQLWGGETGSILPSEADFHPLRARGE